MTTVTYAETTHSPINEIFGFELGMDVTNYKGDTVTLSNGDKGMVVPVDVKGFKNVLITYDQQTNKIISIATMKEQPNNCQEEAKVIMEVLSDKYGKFDRKERNGKTEYYIQDKNKRLVVACDEPEVSEVSIILLDYQPE
jgi:hypothetical protein